MVKFIFSVLFIIFSLLSQAQDTLVVKEQDKEYQDTSGRDSLHNMYGDLLNDDPAYNPRYAVWKPAVRVFTTVAFNWFTSRYIYNFDWARISKESWKQNLKQGFAFDDDRFGTNFVGHPHTGSFYFDVARANGYNYWQSIPFAIEGSLIWEYFGENTRPSLNDLINTPISGALIGEVFHRLSSNILDDRTRGRERVFREIFAGFINPSRALNRLTQGKMFRHTPYEVYQKEPLNITFNAGTLRIRNTNNVAATSATNAILSLQLDYGDPFEIRPRKPFDVFRFRTELSYGNNTKLLGNVNGYGILAGKTVKENRLLAGIFQHFDYWNNSLFQVGAIGFGGGLIARIPVGKKSNIYSTLHLSVVPMAGNNTQFGADTSDFRKYNFGGGFEAKVEETFNINKWASLGFTGFYYYIHTYDGLPGNSLIGIFKPTVTVKIFRGLSLGFEHFIYQNDRFLTGNTKTSLHVTRTEQKVFLRLFLEDSKRKGKYH